MSVTRITRKGQITIPKDVRDGLRVQPSDSVVVVMDGDHAIIYAARERKLADLRGQLPATRTYPGVDEVRAEVGRRMSARGTRKKT
jgi:AbrB family looped-hinge helix DNA binding protein